MSRLRLRAAQAASSGLGLGYLPVAPGTWGSLAALAACWPLRAHPALLATAAIALAAIAVWAGGVAAARARRRDPPSVVADEMAGMAVALLGAPAAAGWPAALLAFAAFRILDVFKPPPVSWLERLPGGWGIVLDDLAAGAAAAVLVSAAS